ncbi:MAG: MFS transporter, partial [Burkholderiales bacterium]
MRRRPVTLAAIGVTLGLTYGVWYSYSVFLVALLNEFGWSRSVLAGAFSVFTLVHGGVNPVIGTLCDRIGPRRLVVFGGAVLGLALYANGFIDSPGRLYLGFGLATALAVACCGWVPAVVLVQRQYMDRLGLSLGIVSSGIGLGMLIVVPLCQMLIESLGWRAAWQILGAICAGWIVPAAWFLTSDEVLRPAQAAASRAAQGPSVARDLRLGEAIRTQPFWLMLGAYFFGNVCSQTLHVHQVAFLVDHGMAAMAAASVVGVVGVASVFGKTGGGWLSDRFEREVIYVIGIAILVAAVGALALVGAAPSRAGAFGFAVLLGVGYSATAAITPAMLSDRFRGPSFGLILGMGLLGSA